MKRPNGNYQHEIHKTVKGESRVNGVPTLDQFDMPNDKPDIFTRHAMLKNAKINNAVLKLTRMRRRISPWGMDDTGNEW